jgi:hypothetical protein
LRIVQIIDALVDDPHLVLFYVWFTYVEYAVVCPLLTVFGYVGYGLLMLQVVTDSNNLKNTYLTRADVVA